MPYQRTQLVKACELKAGDVYRDHDYMDWCYVVHVHLFKSSADTRRVIAVHIYVLGHPRRFHAGGRLVEVLVPDSGVMSADAAPYVVESND